MFFSKEKRICLGSYLIWWIIKIDTHFHKWLWLCTVWSCFKRWAQFVTSFETICLRSGRFQFETFNFKTTDLKQQTIARTFVWLNAFRTEKISLILKSNKEIALHDLLWFMRIQFIKSDDWAMFELVYCCLLEFEFRKRLSRTQSLDSIQWILFWTHKFCIAIVRTIVRKGSYDIVWYDECFFEKRAK